MIESLRRLSPCAALCAILVLAATAVQAQTTTYQFDLPAQPLADALRAVGRQASKNILFDPALVEGISAPALRAELTVSDAVNQLLTGTKLSTQEIAPNTVLIQSGTRDTAKKPVASKTTGVQGTNGYARLAQAATGSSQASPSSEVAAGTSESSSERRIELEEIIVTGTNIRGVYPSSSPVELYTAEDIARTGATTTEQFIAKLPQNLGTRTQYASGYSLTAVNRESVNSIDLHGLGVGTTLTLLNGRRLALSSSGQAADVSLIPLSAIERVEVLTDGASAIYGSDAIGGVVNFVLRDDFEGSETHLSYGGVTDGGLRQTNFAQTFGQQWSSGRALLSYDYFLASALDRSDRSYSTPAGPGKLSPDDDRHGALLTLSQQLGERLTVDGDVAFSKRDVENFVSDFTNPNPVVHSNTASQSETQQYFANIGLNYEVSDSSHLSILASYSDVDVETHRTTAFPAMGLVTLSDPNQDYSALDVTAMLGGSLFELPGGRVRFSVGTGYLDEAYLGAQPSGGTSIQDLGRATTYAFGELFVPLVSKAQGIPIVQRLELSLAARYTSYEESSDPPVGRDFGDRTSPKVGLLWAPAPALSFRATYGESFRAPTLTELDATRADSTLTMLPVGGVPSTVFSVRGPSPQLDAETAESFTFGLDYRPVEHPRLYMSATYFNIDYADRVAIGDTTGGTAARANPAAFPAVIFRAASAEQIEELLRSTRNIQNTTGISLADPDAASLALFGLPNLWISDLRTRNLALSEVDGVDVDVGGSIDTRWGVFRTGIQLTHILEYEQQVAPGSPTNSVVDKVLYPVDLRGRAHAGFSRRGFDATISINYVDDYANPYAIVGEQEIESWTTVDMSLAYDFGSARGGVLDGVRLALSAQNVFDEDPPFVTFSSAGLLRGDVGFDPANANPLGRFVSFGVSKIW